MTIHLGTSVNDDPLRNLLQVCDACAGKARLTDVGKTLLTAPELTTFGDLMERDSNYNQVFEAQLSEPKTHPMLF